jgi:hypothetical protein
MVRNPPAPLPNVFPYQPFHLDVVCPEGLGWVHATDAGGHVLGVLPYRLHRRYGLPLMTPPPLSPQWGPLLFYPADEQTTRQRQDWEWDVLTDLARQLPRTVYARVAWPHNLTYGAPWQRLGWQQRVRYTYCIDLGQSPDTIYAGFRSHICKQIRKGAAQLAITDAADMAAFWELCQHTFRHRGVRQPFAEAFLRDFVAAWLSHGQGRFFSAHDAAGRVHAMLFLVWDADTAYYLLSFAHPVLRKSGAVPLLIWEAIQWAQAQGLTTFDFEGSALPGVEEFFRGFGAQAVGYGVFSRWKVGGAARV